MNIVFIVPMLKISGGIGVALYYAQKMAEEGHRVDILNLGGEVFDYWYPAPSVNIINCRNPAKFSDFLDCDYDLAVATLWSTIHQVRSGIVKARKVAYLIQGDEESFYPLSREDLRRSVRETYVGDELKIVVSPWLMRQLQARYPQEKFYGLTNGVDVEKFSLASPFMAKGKKLRVLIEGAIDSPSKRVRETLNLLRGIEEIETWLVSPVRRDLVGFYPDVSLFEVPYSDMPSIYSSCDVIIKNSQTEGFALPVVEMMAAGGVAIVNDYGAQVDYIQDKVNGIVLPEIDSENILEALNFVISNFENLSKAAKTTADVLRWHDQHTTFLHLVNEHPSRHVEDRIRPGFMRPNWFDREPEIVTFQGPGMSSLARRELLGLRGWISKEGGGDATGILLKHAGHCSPLIAHVERPDVADHFGVYGTYGFELSQMPEEGKEFELIGEDGTVLLKAIIPRLEEMPVRFDSSGIVFVCEAYSTSEHVQYDFARSSSLKDVAIHMKAGSKFLFNGVECEKLEFRTSRGHIAASSDDIIRVTETRLI
jgi:glycosyltransferase involved in cell wall biosynthesis